MSSNNFGQNEKLCARVRVCGCVACMHICVCAFSSGRTCSQYHGKSKHTKDEITILAAERERIE